MRRLLTVMAVFALALRGLVPLGFAFVPQTGPDGRISLVICTGSGAAVITYDKAGKTIAPNPHQASHDSCPFASVLAAVVETGFILRPQQLVASTLVHSVYAETITAQHEIPAPGRGPPRLA